MAIGQGTAAVGQDGLVILRIMGAFRRKRLSSEESRVVIGRKKSSRSSSNLSLVRPHEKRNSFDKLAVKPPVKNVEKLSVRTSGRIAEKIAPPTSVKFRLSSV